MGDSDNRTRKIVTEVVDHMQQIAGMIMPFCCSSSDSLSDSNDNRVSRTIISLDMLVQNTACALIGDIGDPNATHGN